MSIIDCEWVAVRPRGPPQNQGGVVVGTGSTDTNHGTAVIGEISGDRNAFGIGDPPDAIDQRLRSGQTASDDPQRRDRAGAGDIILLEIHRAGPRHNFQGRDAGLHRHRVVAGRL